MEQKQSYPLHTIKRIAVVGTRQNYSGPSNRYWRAINTLLDEGRMLLNIETVDHGGPSKNEHTTFTLGHTDPSADPEPAIAKAAEYTTPEDWGIAGGSHARQE